MNDVTYTLVGGKQLYIPCVSHDMCRIPTLDTDSLASPGEHSLVLRFILLMNQELNWSQVIGMWLDPEIVASVLGHTSSRFVT